MDWPLNISFHTTLDMTIKRTAKKVENTPHSSLTYWNQNWASSSYGFHATTEAVGGCHGNTARSVVAQVGSNFEN